MPATVLIVASDKTSATAYVSCFNKKDYNVLTVQSGRQAIAQAQSHHLDAIVLDATSPRLNYRSLSRRLHNETTAPLILIAPSSARVDGAIAAASVLNKPVAPRKLMARVKAAIDDRPPRVLTVGDLSLDLEKHRLARGTKSFRLTPKQFLLLKALMARAGQTITRKTLMKEVWDTDYLGDTRTLDVHIRWVREKVEENPSKPVCIITMRGQGYKFRSM
jgi:DNA-binding response OmpR family regulator